MNNKPSEIVRDINTQRRQNTKIIQARKYKRA